MEEKLEKLLLQKEFEALSRDEREYVLYQISEADYSEFRNLLGLNKILFDTDSRNLGLRPEIGEYLKKLYRKKYQRLFLMSFLANFKILELKDLPPLFKYGTLGIICFFIGFLLLRPVDQKSSKVFETTAIDIEELPDFEQMNQYMYFDETGADVEIIVP